MKKRGGRFLLVLGAGLAVMAFVVVYIATSKNLGTTKAATTAPPAPVMVSIAVVNQDVPAYTVLDATKVGTLDVDASTVVSGTTSTPSLLYGKTLLMPMTKGQPILANQVTTAGFSNVLEKGKRAFTLAVPERNTFGDSVTENDSVDVLWTHKYQVIQLIPGPDGKPVEHQKDLPTTKTLLQDIKVLRVISLRPQVPPAANGTTTTGQVNQTTAVKGTGAVADAYGPEAPVQEVLILAVTDQQAEVLKFANEGGTIDLALRSSAAQKGPDGKTLKGPDGKDIIGDHDLEKTTGITDKVLVESYGLLLPEILVK
jgi:Flp pilus assembly protein CpaB